MSFECYVRCIWRRHLTAKDYYNYGFASDPTAANVRRIYILSIGSMHSSHRLLQIKRNEDNVRIYAGSETMNMGRKKILEYVVIIHLVLLRLRRSCAVQLIQIDSILSNLLEVERY